LSITCCSKKTTLTILSVLWTNDISTIKFLIDHEPNAINSKNDEGKTALHYAIERNKPEVVKLLLEYGADLNIEDPKGSTPLDYTTRTNNEEINKIITAFNKE